jgi:CheY-like chemotaxis protein
MGSGKRALDVAATGSADVALVDALLPTLDVGVALVRRLAVHVPVVALSLDGASRPEMLAAGAVAFMEKDGAVDELLDALRGAAYSRGG